MDASAVPVWGLVALGLLIVVEILVVVMALVDLFRRPIDQVVFANKWIWVGIIFLVNPIGAIIYLVAGRRPAVLGDDAARSRPSSNRTASVADNLYGPLDGTDRP